MPRASLAGILGCAALLAAGPAGGGAEPPPRLALWIDSRSPVAGGERLFLDDVRPALCALGIVFEGAALPAYSPGIYRAPSPGFAEALVDGSTPVPGGAGTFAEARDPACSGERVVFRGRDSASGRQGVYAWEEGQVLALATQDTPAPHGPQTLTGFSRAEAAGPLAAFKAQTVAGVEAVLLEQDGALEILAVEGGRVPGVPGAAFRAFAPPRLSDRLVAIQGFYAPGESGLYRWRDGLLTRLADRATPVPGRRGETFLAVAQPTVAGGRVVFVGSTAAGTGLYEGRDERLGVLVPPAALLPNGLRLTAVDQPQAAGSRVAFLAATAASPATLYLASPRGLERILAAGDPLGDRTVASLTHALSRDTLALRVLFTDGTQAIYAARLGEPAEVP